MLYILWTVSNVQGPSGPETIRFSNLPYTIDSGPDAGQSFQDCWAQTSCNGFSITETGYRLTSAGVVSAGGVLKKELSSVAIVNNFKSAQATVRQFSPLFSDLYDLTDADVLGEMADSKDGSIPAYADFDTFFTGKVSKRPNRSSDEVAWVFEPILSKLDGPMLNKRFTGMSGYLIWEAGNPIKTPAGKSPVILSGDFTLILYASTDAVTPLSSNKQGLYTIESSSATELLNLYRDSNDNRIKMDVRHATGVDTYDFFSVSGYGVEQLAWIAVQWDAANSKVSAWLDGVKLYDEQSILHAPSGTESTLEMGKADILATQLLRFSAVRTWSRLLNDSEVLERLGVLQVSQESNMESAYEFDEARGKTVTDHTKNFRHISLASSLWWDSDPLDSDPGLEGKIIPLVLGYCYSVPVLPSSYKLNRGFVSSASDFVFRVYSKGVPLALDRDDGVTTYTFNHLTSTIVAGGSGVYGVFFVPGQPLTVGSGVAGTWDGAYYVLSLVPASHQNLRVQGANFKTTIILDAPGWTSSGTDTARVQYTAGTNNWTRILSDSPYYSAGNGLLTEVEFSWTPPQPLTADIMGDPTLLTTSNPAAWVPPDDIANVLLLAMKSYGPQFDNSTLPAVAHGSLGGTRVGYYVNDERSTEAVVDEISSGCLIWVRESAEGVVSFGSFRFPDEIGSSQQIFVDDIVPDSVNDNRVGAARQRLKTPWITSLVTQYARVHVASEESDIPQTVDADSRTFLTNEYRTVISGDAGNVTADTPRFTTPENRKLRAKRIGDRVLRLSKGEIAEFDVRVSGADQPSTYTVGSKVIGDLSKLGLGNVERVVLARRMMPVAGLMTLSLWYELGPPGAPFP